jgi:hypothetical protein
VASNKPVARVEAHLQKLREAGLDTQAFFAALVDIRDDSALSETHREAIYQTIAMESFIWYLEAINGSPMDRTQAAEAIRKLAEAQPAVERTTGDDEEATLPPADFPQQEITVKQRPPKEPKKGPVPKPGVTKYDRPPKKKS